MPDTEVFEIAFGDEVDGKDTELEGAGMIESPGARDEYLFQVDEGQKIIFQLISFEQTIKDVNWSISSPSLGTLY